MKLKLYFEKPVVLYPQLAKALGGMEEAIFFQQLYYWADKGSDKEWIYKTKTEWEEETTLTRRQQDRIRKKLENMGVIETQLKKAKGVPTIHYRIDFGIVQKVLMEKHKRDYSISTKGTNPSYTENTTENTTERGGDKPPTTSKCIQNVYKNPSEEAEEFFNKEQIQENIIRVLKENGAREEIVRREINKFISYWTERNKSGTKQRWQMEKTFEIKRRLQTWLSRINEYQNNNTPKLIKIK
jgi:hypothetical protein